MNYDIEIIIYKTRFFHLDQDVKIGLAFALVHQWWEIVSPDNLFKDKCMSHKNYLILVKVDKDYSTAVI